MDLAGHCERPFALAKSRDEVVLCVTCGCTGKATGEFSTYPFRYIPGGWSVESHTQGLRCPRCLGAPPRFYSEARVEIAASGQVHVRYGRQEATLTTAAAGTGIVNMTNEDEEYGDEGEPVTRGHRIRSQVSDMGYALAEGARLAAANEAGEIFVDIAKELTSDMPMAQMALETPEGKEAAKLLVALMLHTGASQTNVLPGSEFIREACMLQMTASSFALLSPRLRKFRKHLTTLAKIGKQVSATHQVRVHSEEELAEANAELEAELRSLKERMAELEKPAPKKSTRQRKSSAKRNS